MHVTAGPCGSGKPNKKRPGYESAAKFELEKKSIIHIAQDDSGLCCPRAIVTACGLHLAEITITRGTSGPNPDMCRLRQATNALLAEARLRAGPMGQSGTSGQRGQYA